MTVFAPRSHGLLVAGPRTYAALTATALVFLLPFYYLVVAASRPMAEMAQSPPPLTPGPLLFSNIAKALDQQNIGLALVNSLVVAGVITLSTVLLCTLAGYAFAKLRFRGRDRIFRSLLGALVIPSQVAMIPLFALVKELGLVSTYGGVIVPAMASVFGIFLIRQYALSLPDELLEAARIDGASELRIFWSLVVPLIRPILVTLAILTFLATWNDFMWPLIVLTDAKLHTLPVALAGLSREHVQDNELMMSGAVITVLPVLLLFLGLQRYYIAGILAGSVKG